MAELLELNLRAKKSKPPTPPPPPQAAEGLVLELGKKYVTNDGIVVGPMEAENQYVQYPWMCAQFPGDTSQKAFHWEIQDGVYVGQVKTHKRSIRREWTPTWELEEAWMRGEKLEIYDAGAWKHWFIHSYPVICSAFGGPDKASSKTWWKTKYADSCILADGTFIVRRKP
jgi:hypothetical protein